MGDGAMLAAGIAAAVAGIAVLRLSWGMAQRSVAANAAAWLLLAAGALLACAGAGAWGVAVASLWAMGLAAALLAVAAWRSDKVAARPTDRRARMLPQGGWLLDLGRRALTFAMTVPLAMAASLALAVGLHWALKEAGWQPADAIAAALIAVPVVWAVLASVMLMQRTRRMQWLSLGVVALVAVPALLAGG